MQDSNIAKTRLWLIPILIFYLFVAIVILAQLAPTVFIKLPIIDAETYHIWAIEICRGNLAAHEPFFLSPLYPFLLGILYLITGPHPVVATVVQMVLGMVILWGVYELGARMFKPSVGIVAALVLVAFGPFYYFANTLLSATLILFLNTILLWLLWKYRESEKVWHWILLGVIGGLSALARPNIIIFLALLFVPLLVWQGRAGWKRWGWVWLGVAILAVPVVIRNTIVGSDLTLTTTTAGVNIYIGNHLESNGSYTEAPFVMSADASYEAEGYRLEAESRTGRSLTPAAASRYWLGQTVKEIASHPSRYLKLLGRKVFLFFHRVEAPTNVSYYGAQAYSSLLRAFRLDMGLLLPLAMAGLVLSLARGRKYVILYVYLASYLLANLLFFVASEYRFPVVGVLGVFAALFLIDIFRLFRERRVGWIVLGVATYVVFLGLSNHQTEFTRTLASPRMDYFNHGSTLVKWGNSEEAILFFQKALVEDPDFQEAHVQLGWCYLDIGETELAEEEFQRANVPMPDLHKTTVRDSLLNLAYQLAEEEDFQGALEVMEELLEEWQSPPFWIYQEISYLYRIIEDFANADKYERLAQEAKNVNY
jgi:4-amino-4-deoxy-L-arabinose transferase-like glycosyltransferase